jgi:hypothetical protein
MRIIEIDHDVSHNTYIENTYLTLLCKFGGLERIKKIITGKQFFRAHIDNDIELIEVALKNPDTSVFKWIIDCLDSTLLQMLNGYIVIFHDVYESGNLELAKWLEEKYQFFALGFRSPFFDGNSLIAACKSGSIEMFDWIISMCNPTSDYVPVFKSSDTGYVKNHALYTTRRQRENVLHELYIELFYKACKANHIELAEHIRNHYDLCIEDLREWWLTQQNGFNLYAGVCLTGDFDTIKYVYQEVGQYIKIGERDFWYLVSDVVCSGDLISTEYICNKFNEQTACDRCLSSEYYLMTLDTACKLGLFDIATVLKNKITRHDSTLYIEIGRLMITYYRTNYINGLLWLINNYMPHLITILELIHSIYGSTPEFDQLIQATYKYKGN